MENQEIHLRDYLRVIRKRRYVVLTFFSITLALVTLFTFTADRLYKADTMLLIEKAEQYTITEYGFTAHDPEFYATQYLIIKSRPVASKVYDALKDNKLFVNYFDDNSGRKGLIAIIWGFFSGGDSEEKEIDPELAKKARIIETILKNILVRPMRDTRLVIVSYYSRNPELASLIVNTVAKAYIEALFELRMDSSHRAMEWTSRKVDEERIKLDESERALQAYKWRCYCRYRCRSAPDVVGPVLSIQQAEAVHQLRWTWDDGFWIARCYRCADRYARRYGCRYRW